MGVKKSKRLPWYVAHDTVCGPLCTSTLHFPAESHHGERSEHERTHKQPRSRPNCSRKTQASPGHSVQTVHRPASRHEHRYRLQPLRENKRRDPSPPSITMIKVTRME